MLVLQGGGALGAYQGGVYEALSAQGHVPDWVSGISIGAINGAIIAGNAPERRVARLREFWQTISALILGEPPLPGDHARTAFNATSAALVTAWGAPGFFSPRIPPALLHPPGALAALSVYDTTPLRRTLEELIDFDLLNSGAIRLSVGAVNVRTGNFVYFDSAREEIRPEHIMASGALPPGFPPVEIEGEYYWDGGLLSNTPLQYVLDNDLGGDALLFQVDLFSARGPLPGDLADVAERAKDIRYSSRTRLNTDVFRRHQTLRRSVHRLLAKLPEELRDDPDARRLRGLSSNAAITIVHLIHRRKNYETQAKDYEFSRLSVDEHWRAGSEDVERTLRHRDWIGRARPEQGVAVLDLTRDPDS